MRAASRAAWVPPLLVGASAAVAAEVASGMLLYAGPGLARSLTAVLAVEAAALAVGLRRGSGFSGNVVERLRRRWLLCLSAFIAAALFGTSWSVVESVGGGAVGQGLGLAVLAALPLYGCGLVLGGMAAVGSRNGSPGPGAPAVAGAALGFVLTGVLLPRAPIPDSLLVACLVMLSAAGLIYGIVLGAGDSVYVRAVQSSGFGEVRVEDRVRGAEHAGVRQLTEAGWVRRAIPLASPPSFLEWDVAVADAALEGVKRPARLLSIGGGASALARTLSERPGLESLHVLERNGVVLRLADEYLATGVGEAPTEKVRVEVGNLEDLIAGLIRGYDLLFVDHDALLPLGGAGALSRAAWTSILGALGDGGVLVYGPLRGTVPGLELPTDWTAAELLRTEGSVADHARVVVVSRDGAAPWVDRVEGFARIVAAGVES